MQYAQLYVNDIQLDLPADSLIALSYAVNTLTDLKSVQGNISNSISLPDTANNRAALGYPEDLNFNGAALIRNKLPCRYVQNGVEVIPQGNLRIVGASKGNLKIVISSGNTDFFDLLTGKLRELDMHEYDHLWNIGNVMASRLNTTGYLYPIINYGTLLPDGDHTHSTGVYANEMRPAIFARYLVQKIVASAGYTLNDEPIMADPVTAPIYSNLLLPFSSDKFIHPKRYTDQYSPADIEYRSAGVPQTISTDRFPIPILFATKVKDHDNLFDGTYWTAPRIMTVDVSVTFSHITVTRSDGGDNSRGATFRIYVRPAGDVNTAVIAEHARIDFKTEDHLGEWDGITLSATIGVNPGDRIWAAYISSGHNQPVGVQIHDGSNFQVKLNADNVLYGEMVQIEGALPDMSTTDFLKVIQFLFCAIIQTDNISKTVSIVPFGHIVQNMPYALDWSDKITNDGEEFDVQIGDYCQQNEAKWQHDDTVTPDTYANGSFTLVDKNLNLYQDIYDLPFAASLDVVSLAAKYKTIQISKVADIYSSNAFETQTQPRICLLNKINTDIIYYQTDGNSQTAGDNIPLTWFASGSPIIADLTLKSIFQNHYRDLVNVLNDQRKLTCYLMLNEIDIQTLDFFKPVYISKYATYFYISKITDFTGVKPCKVELIKL